MTARRRLRIGVHGVVQGVGFRPFVYTTAATLGLTGCVRNDSSGAVIEVEGTPGDLETFLRRLRTDPPVLAVIESVETQPMPVSGGTGFTIADTSRSGGGRTLASPDVAMCPECTAEQRDPSNRRYRHAFVNCTNCGPRFTIIAALPYDRDATTMASFAMCAECAREYADPADRRFHAQPVCCPSCGPTLRWQDASGALIGEAGLQHARELLAGGAILAVKGIGGYHLACDAQNATAVTELRRRKRRGDKPFAVMVPDLHTAREIAEVDDTAARVLCGPQRPIVLVPRLPGAPVAESVAPHNPDLGILLAYTPLHALLFGLPGDSPGPAVLVMTSANISGEPICFSDDDALQRLSQIADGWLMHDREILVPCDDSVVRVADGEELPIRRSRGYAPLPVALPVAVPPTLAVGADLKNTIAVADHEYAWLSAYIGDMDSLATLSAFERAVRHLEALTGVEPETLVCDAHPGYRSSDWAHRNAGPHPVRTVQHHHAHIAAVMAEHGLDGTHQVLGFAFDGTGYGPDGTVWGGEVLLADYKGFRRVAHLTQVPMAGGDVSVLRPYRMALSHLRAAGLPWDADLPPVRACPDDERRTLAHQLATGAGCVPTSSMGRLFDAVSALIGVRQTVAYEAQAAIELEGISRNTAAGNRRYAFELDAGAAPVTIDPAPILAAIVDDMRAGVTPAAIGARFHRAVAELIVELALELVDANGCAGQPVALSGGVFQNLLLLRLTLAGLREAGLRVITHRRVPPNDGGIALGQLLVGNAG
ncbi:MULTISPECIES: carbamoyltransferase HypF [unclassified Mycolicibacterium]|uniref:carbamoyltransferase HypF n=1 Tax=unclassified Mycolicibacterium TaxID=2636767 RepID=UPI0013077ACC|nr:MULTISPECIES: carbamoyltransferase HypF [unclassified Mycolicibacterium]MUL80318.1 carbamoyltransferase HypF [Mycolicibacterium sp. CBMA 329]MUL86085.1 carbamoyltransferase HypF [Mycolicibacterium sp. CBMA 331]MUM00859.1 carbamoyltransferase HypF [Mycolicibacterium sp. CBMA 334]MUM36381.1 carbamoyltransferase HypF [Mycolicibacterium sp. CBMA 247]MUM42149.1 carbamoyltransferase HypF [Mycolicibacterium sp. CBMA 294]